MKATVLPTGHLRISVDKSEQRHLRREMKGEKSFDTDNYMLELFDSFIANSEYQWLRPEQISALTSAPILGILGETRALNPDEEVDKGTMHVGHWGGADRVQPILIAWGFMDYQVISVQRRLAEQGEAVFTLGWEKGR